MDRGHKGSPFDIRVIILEEELASFFVEGTFGVGDDEEALDGLRRRIMRRVQREKKRWKKKHTRRTCSMPWEGFQSFLRVLTQISPFSATLGWKILVKKYPLGGAY